MSWCFCLLPWPLYTEDGGLLDPFWGANNKSYAWPHICNSMFPLRALKARHILSPDRPAPIGLPHCLWPAWSPARGPDPIKPRLKVRVAVICVHRDAGAINVKLRWRRCCAGHLFIINFNELLHFFFKECRPFYFKSTCVLPLDVEERTWLEPAQVAHGRFIFPQTLHGVFSSSRRPLHPLGMQHGEPSPPERGRINPDGIWIF